MRILLLLGVVGLLAGCATEVKYDHVRPEKRAAVLEAFGFSEGANDPGPYAVLVIATDEANVINPEATTSVVPTTGPISERLSSAERATVNHCLRYKEADETCYVVYKGGWIEE